MKRLCFLPTLLIVGLAVSAQVEPAAATQNEVEAFYSTTRNKHYNYVDDAAFLRRISLDLTGRLPTPAETLVFLNSQDPDKRKKAVQQYLSGSAFNERWTAFFEELMENDALFQNAFGRNGLHKRIAEDISTNTPVDQLFRNILTFQGPGISEKGAFPLFARGTFNDEFRLDYLDDLTTQVTEAMLGVKVDCISCHDGAYHLEQVNKGLSLRQRTDLWGMSAFFAKTYVFLDENGLPGDDEPLDEATLARILTIIDLDDTHLNVYPNALLADEPFDTGDYLAETVAGQGMRQPRAGGIVEPVYMFTGEKPRAGEPRRKAFARMITADRQFARNIVNRVWAHFYGEGFVMPLNGWDLGRIDPETAASFEAEVQPRNHRLMEHLTDQFIQSNYNLKDLITIVTGSELYQRDYRDQPGTMALVDPLSYWSDRKRMRRLPAESIFDSVHRLLGIPQRYIATGLPRQVLESPWALPAGPEPSPAALVNFTPDGYEFYVDPLELGYNSQDEYFFFQFRASEFLQEMGRPLPNAGILRDNKGGIQSNLMLLNRYDYNFWLDYAEYAPALNYFSERLAAVGAVQTSEEIFRHVLFRAPSRQERAAAAASLDTNRSHQTIANLFWALFNHPDFLYR